MTHVRLEERYRLQLKEVTDFESFLLQLMQETKDHPFYLRTPTIWALQRKPVSYVLGRTKMLTLVESILKQHKSTKVCLKNECYLLIGVGDERVEVSYCPSSFFLSLPWYQLSAASTSKLHGVSMCNTHKFAGKIGLCKSWLTCLYNLDRRDGVIELKMGRFR